MQREIPALAIPVEKAQVKKRLGKEKVYRNLALLVMCLPAILYTFIFRYTTMFGVIIAFKDYKAVRGIFESAWVGLKNFEYLIGVNEAWIALRNTLTYNVMFIFFGTVASLIVAFLVYEVYTHFMTRFYQTTLYFPNFISWIIVSYFVFAFLGFEDGMVNKLLVSLGLNPVSWYKTEAVWPGIFVLLNLWKGVGGGSLFYLAGMLSIDPQLFEAARVDGASRWQEYRHITLPLLAPIIVIQIVLAVGGIFGSDFGLFYIVPRQVQFPTLGAAKVIDTFIYRSLVNLNNPGMAAAAGLMQATAGFILVLLTNWVVRRIDPDRTLF